VGLTTSHRKSYCYGTQKGGKDSYRVVQPMMMMLIVEYSNCKGLVSVLAAAIIHMLTVYVTTGLRVESDGHFVNLHSINFCSKSTEFLSL
jgi:hypothetical protein